MSRSVEGMKASCVYRDGCLAPERCNTEGYCLQLKCFSAGCKETQMTGSVLCQEHYDALPEAMRGRAAK
jgi:hypothetical protein